jgi:GNAT superfamily N-acetyltransferase
MFRIQQLSAAEFLAEVVPVLGERELENNLIIGLGQRLAAKPEADAVLGAILDRHTVVGGVLWIPPHFAVVSTLSEGAEDAVVTALLAQNRGLDGACAPGHVARNVARLLAERIGGRAELVSDEVLYELTRVVPPRPAPGAARLATLSDLPLVTHLIDEFFAELNMPHMHSSEAEAVASRAVEARRAHLWEDGDVRSLACQARSMLTGAAIAPVFTPRAHRGRGYASALTAELCQSLLDAGHRFVCLHAERANATSNHIYQSIGFREAGSFQVWAVR